MEDVVQELGYLTLGTRLKRLGERVQADTQRILESCDLRIPAGQWPFLAALDRLGPLTVGDLAKAVGVTQPGTTRTVSQLSEDGLVTVDASDEDQRCRRVSLTAQGRRLVATGKQVAWPVIERAVADLCDDLKGGFLSQLDAMEAGLDTQPLIQRVSKGRRR